jgi:hypothetical protein
MQNNSIQELLDKQITLHDIASVLYGEDYIFQKQFWGSPTELEMKEIYEQLDILGYEEPISEEMWALGDIIFNDLKNQGFFPEDDEDGEDDLYE